MSTASTHSEKPKLESSIPNNSTNNVSKSKFEIPVSSKSSGEVVSKPEADHSGNDNFFWKIQLFEFGCF